MKHLIDDLKAHLAPQCKHFNAARIYGKRCIYCPPNDPVGDALVECISASVDNVGQWLSAANEDPMVCDEMKADIKVFFETLGRLEEALKIW